MTQYLSFDDMPIWVQLKVFSYLDIHSILNAQHVSNKWKSLSSDNVLWNKRLEIDMKKWNVIGHSFNPLAFTHLPSKDIYHNCSPITRKLTNDSLIDRFTKVLRSIVISKTPKLAMFGPGLDAGGVKLVRRLLQDNTKTFQCIAMHPSQFEGVGSGVVLRLLNHQLDFVLITLYTAPKHQRESRSIRERNASNILVSNIPPQIPLNNLPQIPPNNPPNILGDSQNRNPNFNLRPNNQNHINNPNNPNNPLPTPRNHLKLQKSIHDLMKTQDGLVYVLDASCSIPDLESGLPELLALSHQLLNPSPLLILLCSLFQQPNALTCMDVVRIMTLSKLTRPWQVHHCIVEGMLGVEKAFHWIVEASRR